MSQVTITCDPEFDLHAAGEQIEEADDFYAAWAAAAAGLGAALELELIVSRSRTAEKATCHEDADGESFETALWQTAHNMVHRTDGRWVAREPPHRVVQALRRFAQRVGILADDADLSSPPVP